MWISSDEGGDVWLRLAVFVTVFSVMALLEVLAPCRKLTACRKKRWATNLSIVGLDSVMVRVLALLPVPIAAVSAAIYAEQSGWGLFLATGLPSWVQIGLGLVCLDFALWLQHWASHKFDVLWRVHQMHHADVDIDVTTAIRFHPIEIALSMVWKVAWVLVLGIPPVAVFAFEIILNGAAMFNHANIQLPERLDRRLRIAIVTPDMHRVHHSVISGEHNSNYGFNLSVWDRLFSTYTDQPKDGHQGMRIGLEEFQSDEPTELVWSLQLPFESRTPIN